MCLNFKLMKEDFKQKTYSFIQYIDKYEKVSKHKNTFKKEISLKD